MPNEDNKILKYNHGEKSMRALYIIYADLSLCLKKWTLVMIIQKNHQQLTTANKKGEKNHNKQKVCYTCKK